jgi:hypothetical protein
LFINELEIVGPKLKEEKEKYDIYSEDSQTLNELLFEIDG